MDIRDAAYSKIENLPNEVWKDIPGFEEVYEVSSEGRVRSKERYVTKIDYSTMYIPPKILTPNITSRKNKRNATYAVTLASHGTDKHHYCRSLKGLVADAFLPKDENDKENVHLVLIDNQYDFSVENLIYISYKELKELNNM